MCRMVFVCVCVCVYALFVYEIFLFWLLCKPRSVNGILGRIDSPIPNRFSDKVIDRLSSGANGIQQVDLGRGWLLQE